MKHSFLTIVFGLFSYCAFADTTNVTLHIATLSTDRVPTIFGRVHTNSITFSCEATLDNQTGGPLAVTGYYSVFDGLRLVVMDTNGKELARQGYSDVISTTTTQSLTLPVGETKKTMIFPFLFIPSAAQTVSVRVEGGLPDSSFSGSVTSNVVAVKIGK